MTGLEQLRKVIEEIDPDSECSEIHRVFGDDFGRCHGRSCDECQLEALRKCANNIETEIAGLQCKAEFFKRLDSRIAEFLGIEEASYAELESKLKKRLLPKGVQWPVFEDGEPVEFGDLAEAGGSAGPVVLISLYSAEERHNEEPGYSIAVAGTDGIYHSSIEDLCVRIGRPLPKVLDADGVEIHVGDTVFDKFGDKHEVKGFDKQGNVLLEFHNVKSLGWSPLKLTHRAPVLASDGKPLLEGETVYELFPSSRKIKVLKLNDSNPKISECLNVRCLHLCEDKEYWYDPRKLTHEPQDSWEQLEEDALKDGIGYFRCGRECSTCRIPDELGISSANYGIIAACAYAQRKDLVRRAKKLAEAE